MLIAVDDETVSGTDAQALVVEKGRRLEDVDIVVRTGYSKVRMSNPQPVVSYRFKDHREILALETGSVHPFSGGRTVLPLLMHTIYSAQHSRNPC